MYLDDMQDIITSSRYFREQIIFWEKQHEQAVNAGFTLTASAIQNIIDTMKGILSDLNK